MGTWVRKCHQDSPAVYRRWLVCLLEHVHTSQSTLEGLKLCGLRQEKAFRHLDSSILIASASWVNMASLIPDHGPWANWKFVSPEESVHATMFLPWLHQGDETAIISLGTHCFATPPRGSTSHITYLRVVLKAKICKDYINPKRSLVSLMILAFNFFRLPRKVGNKTFLLRN